MKRIIIAVVLIFFGMTAFSQDMSSYLEEYMRPDGTFAERLAVLEVVREAEITGIGEFYHEALRFLLLRAPDIRNRTEQENAERSAVILCQGLGAERFTDAALALWHTAELFDIVREANDGNAMQAALIALGDVGGVEFIPHIVQRLNDFNSQTIRNPEARRRIQMGVIGCIMALETLGDVRGFRPVFFASLGQYDPAVREIAANALPNIAEDPADIIIAIIQDPGSDPRIKLTAWREMLRTNAPDESKARVAAVALATGWNFATTNRNFQTNLREMRKSAIEAIRMFGAADDSVYDNLERSYNSNFISNTPDFDEIMLTLNALTAIRTERAVELLHKFLREINGRRRSGPWARKERQLFEWLISCIGATGTQSQEIRLLLTTIQRNSAYTSQEQNMARDAIRALSQ
jgi:hypothetical protein